MSDDLADLKAQELREAQEEMLRQATEVGSICLWCKHAMLMQIDIPDPRVGGPGLIGVPRLAALQVGCLKLSVPLQTNVAVRACGGWEFGENTIQSPDIRTKLEESAPKVRLQ